MANMATCPNCGRPVSGRARRCGYCGESLLEDYFSAPGMELGGEEGPSAGATAATVLGSFGAVALIVALVFQLLVLFGFGPEALVPSLDLAWWLRTLAMTVLPVVYLVQQLLLGGHRKSLVFDAVSLFLGMWLLTTKLFCGYCGAYLCGESGTSRTGVVHHYYKCVSVKKKRTDCHKKPVRKEWLEDMVVNATMKMLMNDATIGAIVSALMTLQDEENVNLPLYEKQLRETKTAIDNLLNAIQQGLLTRSTKERLDALEAAQDELENKIACEKLAKPRITEEQLRFFLEKFRKMDVANQAQRKMLIDTFVNAIFLYDDKVVLTYNFHEGTETISFEELQKVTEAGASGSDLVSSTAPAKAFERTEGFFVLLTKNRSAWDLKKP